MKVRPAALVALALPLAGCFRPPISEFPPACPALRPLPTAQDMVLYRPGGGHDLVDVQIEGSILSAGGKCQDEVQGKTVKATITLSMHFQRGPAAPTRQANIPYFVGVARGDTILNKLVKTVQVTFPPNVDTANVSTQPVQVILPVGPDRSAAAYTLWVGFQKQR